MDSEKVYFVSGIDTDAGKSYATGALAALWRSEGIETVTQKFIQTGCGDDTDGISEDILLHRRIMGIDPLPEDINHLTNPLRFRYPASPALAAAMEGREADLDAVCKSAEQLSRKFDRVLIEGAGGLMVPIKGLYTTADYVQERKLPLILVTNPKLGSINHTFLSLEVCRGRNIPVHTVIYNHYPVTSDEITADTRLTIIEYLAAYHPQCDFIEVPYINLGNVIAKGSKINLDI